MIDYQREQQQTIPVNQVKIIGVGGAGANMLDRVALDGADASTMLALNTDQRTLTSAMAGEKVQLGTKLTMGLGAGGDPEIGLRAAQEVETEIRDSLRNQKIVFICVGLGGGTGSGAAPLVTRIAREQGAFVVVFATMPFEFEGKRRREQAETALNELSVLSNSLVTFDNGKMGELVLASQGIHEAFAAADVMISQSIKAVTRLVIKPGIINVGLDDLMAALKTTKSRCLFGSGLSDGENRSQKALSNALNSPLLDKGALLKSATTVLVHICGGVGMSLYEVELLMRDLAKHVPSDAHILFGAAVDESMGDNLSVTLISALPESLLLGKAEDKSAPVEATTEKKSDEQPVAQKTPESNVAPAKEGVIQSAASTQAGRVVLESVSTPAKQESTVVTEKKVEVKSAAEEVKTETKKVVKEEAKETSAPVSEEKKEPQAEKEPEKTILPEKKELLTQTRVTVKAEPELLPESTNTPEPKKVKLTQPVAAQVGAPEREVVRLEPKKTEEAPTGKPQTELPLDGGPKGKFSGEAPNVVDGEDLDIPPFLRNR